MAPARIDSHTLLLPILCCHLLMLTEVYIATILASTEPVFFGIIVDATQERTTNAC